MTRRHGDERTCPVAFPTSPRLSPRLCRVWRGADTYRLLGTLLKDASYWHIDPGAHLMRQCHRLCLADVLRSHLAHAGKARQAHGTDEFVLQDLQHAHNAVLTTSGEAPRLHSTKGDHVGA